MTGQPSQPTTGHTPTPWRVSGFEQVAGGGSRVIMGADNFSIAYVMDRTPAENDADAAFIVEAVNSHATLKARAAELEGALETAESEARRYAEMYPQSSDGRNTFIILADRITALSHAGPVARDGE
jgi:hypothetical protein